MGKRERGGESGREGGRVGERDCWWAWSQREISTICLIKLGTVELHKASRWLREDSIHHGAAARPHTRTWPECVAVPRPHALTVASNSGLTPAVSSQARRHLATSKPPQDPGALGWARRGAMHQQTKEERDPPKTEGNEETSMSASAEALDSPSSDASGAQAEQARATLTPDPRRRCGFFCQPWCLLLTLTLLLLSLLGSWAVVHLTLGTHGGSPFRVSGSYDQRIPQDDAATIEPHFTTNCTMGKLTHPCHSSQKWLSGNGDADFVARHILSVKKRANEESVNLENNLYINLQGKNIKWGKRSNVKWSKAVD